MAQEIERKFLVKGKFKPEVFKSTRITQGYLSFRCRNVPFGYELKENRDSSRSREKGIIPASVVTNGKKKYL